MGKQTPVTCHGMPAHTYDNRDSTKYFGETNFRMCRLGKISYYRLVEFMNAEKKLNWISERFDVNGKNEKTGLTTISILVSGTTWTIALVKEAVMVSNKFAAELDSKRFATIIKKKRCVPTARNKTTKFELKKIVKWMV